MHPDLAGSFRGGAATGSTCTASSRTWRPARPWLADHRPGDGHRRERADPRRRAAGQVDRRARLQRSQHRPAVAAASHHGWLLDPDGNPATPDAQIVLNAWGLGDRPGVCDTEFERDLRWLRAAGMHVGVRGRQWRADGAD